MSEAVSVHLDIPLSSFPSYISYNDLDRGYGIEENDEHSAHWSYVKSWFPNYPSIYSVSEKLLKCFYYVSYMRDSKYSYSERWNYLYYWMGDKILAKLDDTTSFYEVMRMYDFVRNITDSKSKNIYKEVHISKEDFKNLKKIYDYSQNYPTILNKIRVNDNKCSKSYKEYIQEHSDLYNQLKQKCSSKEEPCYSIFNYIKENSSHIDLSKLECTESESVVTSHGGGRDGLSQTSLLPGGHEKMLREQDSFSGSPSQFMDGSYVNPSSSPSTSHTSFAITFSLLGGLFFSLVLYKFTPLGSWLRFHFPRKKNIQSEMYEEDPISEFSNNLYEDDYTSSHTNSHQIGYNPS
ncbi:PIR protein [Plasmodium ovale]|uniref:PIR protein n=1 Tax=Plasmodium ovale TaxID=36330 RepID=A0A1C3KJG6_PLAOA|nr:PIR protein [Plasmodium ovale]